MAMYKKVFIIAEAGVNHNGDVKIAKKMVDIAVWAGADAVKFQTFNPEHVMSKHAPKAAYQKKTTNSAESQLDMIRKLRLGEEEHKDIMEHCKDRNIMFLSTPFDLDSVDLLERLGLDIFKIPSGEIRNLPYLRKIGALKKKVIISSGMADMGEMQKAIDVLIEAGTAKDDIVVLHCTTEYPALKEDANLLAIPAIRNTLEVKVGYSDHTLGIEIAIAAVALGVSVIEKHFTLDKNAEGPDHKASLEPEELKRMVDAVRNTEKALGDGIKKPSISEEKNKFAIRKSLVVVKKIKKGEPFTAEAVMAKRPAGGMSPMEWDKVIDSVAKKDFNEGDFVEL